MMKIKRFIHYSFEMHIPLFFVLIICSSILLPLKKDRRATKCKAWTVIYHLEVLWVGCPIFHTLSSQYFFVRFLQYCFQVIKYSWQWFFMLSRISTKDQKSSLCQLTVSVFSAHVSRILFILQNWTGHSYCTFFFFTWVDGCWWTDSYDRRLPKKVLEATRQYSPVIKSNNSKAALYEIDFTGLHTENKNVTSHHEKSALWCVWKSRYEKTKALHGHVPGSCDHWA